MFIVGHFCLANEHIYLKSCKLYESLLFQTNDVNQGDALEHDFSTLYLALTFPVKHLLDAKLSQVRLNYTGTHAVTLLDLVKF